MTGEIDRRPDSIKDGRLSLREADFATRIAAFNEWLREGGNADVADLIQDLYAALRTGEKSDG